MRCLRARLLLRCWRGGGASVRRGLLLHLHQPQQPRRLHTDGPGPLRTNGQHRADAVQPRHYGAGAEDGPVRQVRRRHLPGEQWQHRVRRLLRWLLLPRRRRRRPALRGGHLQQRHRPRGAGGVLRLPARRRVQHWRDRAGRPGTVKGSGWGSGSGSGSGYGSGSGSGEPLSKVRVSSACAATLRIGGPLSCSGLRPLHPLPPRPHRHPALPPAGERVRRCRGACPSLTTTFDRPGLCSPGSYADETGMPTCALCQPGEYQPEYNSTGCLPCATASYCPGYGTTSPTPCPGGTWSNTTGLYDAQQCVGVEAGFWAPTGSGAPKACPASGFTCPGRAADKVNDPPGSEPILVESGQSSVDVEVAPKAPRARCRRPTCPAMPHPSLCVVRATRRVGGGGHLRHGARHECR